MTGQRVVVVGGGVIGAAAAWRLARDGAVVTVFDPDPARAAATVAAGMLAPATEARWGEDPLVALNLASAARWDSFAAEVEKSSGERIDYRRDGLLCVAVDAGDRAELDDLAALFDRTDVAYQRLAGRECRDHEPMLRPMVRGGLLIIDDGRVDPRRLLAALRAGAGRAGAAFRSEAVDAVSQVGRAVTGVRLGTGDEIPADLTVVAAGAWTGLLGGLDPEMRPPVRPVKGELLRVSGPPGFLQRTIRAVNRGRHVYLVPRASGEIVVGATTEDRGFDLTTTVGAAHDLLTDAVAVVPGLRELEVIEHRAGLRPATPDNAPVIAAPCPGLVLACGHHRNGVLLTPITTDAIAAFANGTDPPTEVAPFDLARFDRVVHRSRS